MPEELESPFAHLLGTNYVPTDSETRQILNLLSQSLSELCRLDTEIDRLRAIIYDLLEQRHKTRKFVNDHRALLSPARRLPSEIVGEIFVHCLPTTRNAVKSTREAPLLLGRICSAWRNISLLTPRLWSSMHLVIPVHSDPSKIDTIIQLRCEALKEWLGRSGTLPLSVSLTTSDSYYPHSSPGATPLMATLIQFSRRWNSIDLCLPYDLLESFDILTKDDVPCLEIIKISMCNWTNVSWHFPILGTAPRLHRVSFVFFQGNPLNLPLSWARLAELSLETVHNARSPNFSDALAMLKQCCNLQSFTLGIFSALSGGSSPPSEPVELLALHTLRLRSSLKNSDELTVIFDHLFTPSLVELEVTSIIHSAISHSALRSHVPFMSLLTRSSCSLERLTLSEYPISSEALIECLHLVPTLTTLFLTDCSWGVSDEVPETFLNDELLRLLTATNSESAHCLVPLLKSVKLLQCTAISDEVLIDFIESRWRRPLAVDMKADIPRTTSAEVSRDLSGIEASRLTNVQVGFTRAAVVDISPRVQTLREEGLDIDVYCPFPDRYGDGMSSLLTVVPRLKKEEVNMTWRLW